ncbi:MAG: hypothetical protein R3D59_16780 [Paracoccaceae bacterium]
MTRTLPALALALGLAAPALAPALAEDAFDFDAMGESEQRRLRRSGPRIPARNPEVIMEAVAVLETRRQAAEQVANDAALIATNRDAIFNDPMTMSAATPRAT